MKVAYLFPGQGAQYVGMGQDLYEKFDEARRVFDRANEILGFDLAKICFEGPENELTLTNICQPALLTMSFACIEVLKTQVPTLQPQAVAGLSLGEFTALTLAQAFSFEEGLKVVEARGRFMQEACRERKGAMASILGMEFSKLHLICKSVASHHIITIANVNCPGQIVVSGEPEGVALVVAEAKVQGAKRAIELQVSGAFHSPLMESARLKLKSYLDMIDIKSPKLLFVSNVLGREVSDPSQIKQLLIDQVTGSVLWEQDVRTLVAKGYDTFVETGCGTVLSGLQRKIHPESKVFHFEDIESLEGIKAIQN